MLGPGPTGEMLSRAYLQLLTGRRAEASGRVRAGGSPAGAPQAGRAGVRAGGPGEDA